MANNTYTLKEICREAVFLIGEQPEIETVEQEPNDPFVRSLITCVNDVLREFNRHRGLRLQNQRYTFNTVDDYTTGTVDITQGSTTVTGTSTVWTSAMVGRAFATNREDSIHRITAVDSSTSITLDSAWPHDDVDDGTYRIAQDRYEAPSNLREIKFGSIAGDRSWPLEIRDPVYIEHERYSVRTKAVETGTPVLIGFDPERSSDRNYNILLDPFPDEIYQVNLLVNLAMTELKLDADLLPIEDDSKDVFLDGVVAKWKSRRPKDRDDRAAWEVYLETIADRFLAANEKGTDQQARIVPDDVMRSVPTYIMGRPDWKDR